MPRIRTKSAGRANQLLKDAFAGSVADGFGASFPLLFQCNPAPMFLYDWDTWRILEVNDSALALYGYNREQFLRLSLRELMVPDEATQRMRDRISNVNLVKLGPRRHRKADGTIFFVDILRDRLTSSGRKLALVVCQDATERLAAEEQIRRSADHLRRSHENLARAQRIASTGSVERDFHLKKTEWSDETYRIFGIDRESWTPSPQALLDFVHPEDRARVAEELSNSSKGIPCPLLKYRIFRPDGTERMIHREVEVIFDEAGKPVRSISTIRDVTEAHEAAERQKKLETELRVAKEEAEVLARAIQEANLELECRVEERTAELRTAQIEVLKSERLSTLGQLTATVAHELRNPLSAIKNSIFAVKVIADHQGVRIDRPMNRIERSIDRCNLIISDLLDYARIRELQCRIRVFDAWLAEVVAEQTVPAGTSVVLDLRAEATRVRFDAERLRQVVINLFDNAVQAMAATSAAGCSPRLTFRTRTLAIEIELIVEDNGPGIAPEYLARAFEPLFSTKPFGTGLGLPTVKQIVEQHSGKIELVSAIGEGTRVLIRLPLALDDVQA